MQTTTDLQSPRRYVYKLTVDNGGAPCVCEDVLSLAICKPMIRMTARIGDVIFGFAANSLSADNRLIYIARITEALDDGEYYHQRKYSSRPDCIYYFRDGHFRRRQDARYHDMPGDLAHDLGTSPDYVRARVLISQDFRYFRDHCPIDLARYPRIRSKLAHLKQGHRVNHDAALARELAQLEVDVWRAQQRVPQDHESEPPTADPRAKRNARGVVSPNLRC